VGLIGVQLQWWLSIIKSKHNKEFTSGTFDRRGLALFAVGQFAVNQSVAIHLTTLSVEHV